MQALTALSDSALTDLDSSIVVPSYDRSALRPAIVHIGVGGFHRAHLATYIDELCEAGHTDWSIVGSGVMPGDVAMRDALADQDHLYTLVTRGASTTDVQVIGSITDYVLASDGAAPLIARIADPATQIVSLTVTEGGYPVDDVTGAFEPDSPNAAPTSAFGLLVQGLDARRQQGGPPITVLSCDNIMTNGNVTRTATLATAAQVAAELVAWIESSVSFPNSMVDRITPATADSDRRWLEDTHNLSDRWPVVTEPFRQWVIEDNFAGDRLPLDELDVIVTHDVEPYEFMKLRLLNAGHSCLAYLAALSGIETVDAAMAEPWIEDYLRTFLHVESKPVLPAVAGVDVDTYIETLIERFSNPAIGDQIARLCLDGSAKFPKFLMPTVRAQVAADGPHSLSALALAGWCQYLIGRTDDGQPIDVANDPALDAVAELAQESLIEPTRFLAYQPVFGDDLGPDSSFATAFAEALIAIRTTDAKAATIAAVQGLKAGDARG